MTRTDASARTMTLGTRGSALALRQTQLVADALTRLGIAVRIEVIRTRGDAMIDRPIAALGGKGAFTQELEDALFARRIDLAVHSLKDLPTDLPTGLTLAAILKRDDPRDVLIGSSIDALSHADNAIVIGTSSLRRQAQLRRCFPKARIVEMRGNVDTRLAKVAAGQVSCAVLAMAGLARLNRTDAVSAIFDAADLLPAPAQGALAIETREDDPATGDLVRQLHCEATAACVLAERAFLHELGGGCHVPVAALPTITGHRITLHARVIAIDGSSMIEQIDSDDAASADVLGRRIAQHCKHNGADALLRHG